ncbi:hypothetical protein ACHHYP_06060 [Achlya hypogyna]|uniref:SWIM-type domain-containing protein n=1 Tax=Achlya hypogyna TaxID=1202772 RepID=A0A1V9YVI9_ACHHY|nr:hypothetical protein ACHHYP_06060 [Achlya hypogyna]
MFKVFRPTSPTTPTKEARGIKHWFRAVLKPTSKCTCSTSRSKIRISKPKPCLHPVFVVIPVKYANERKLRLVVSGQRVPYLPSQVSQWKTIRRDFTLYPTIEEEAHNCDHCQCRSSATSIEDDDDDEY